MSIIKKYQVIDPQNSEQLNELIDYVDNPDVQCVAFDIETDSLVKVNAKVIGIAVSVDPGEGRYIVLQKFDPIRGLIPTLDPSIEQDFITEFCKVLLNKKLIMHNGVFDIAVMYFRYKIDLTPALFADTILMKHTVDEERPFGLKDLADKYKLEIGFSEEDVANQEQVELSKSVKLNGGRWNQKQKDIYKADYQIIGKYAAADVDLTARLYDYFNTRLEKEGLSEFFYDKEVMPLYKKVTIPMCIKGIFVNVDYFKQLEKELERGIMELTTKVFELIKDDIKPRVESILDSEIKETKTGKFAERALQYYNIPIPLNKRTGKPTLAKSALQELLKIYPDHIALRWLLYAPASSLSESSDTQSTSVDKITETDRPSIPKKDVYAIKKEIFVEANPDLPHVFNLASIQDLSWLVFEKHKENPKEFSRKTGAPKLDKDSLTEYDHLPFVKTLLKLRLEEKILNTYIRPILDSNINGWLYPDMLQYGTTSGRYSCGGGLNLQTLPREDKRIKKGFIAPPGYKVVNADYSSLEPRSFSWVTGDIGLKQVWSNNLDLYSQVAIDVFNLKGVSADETAPNYLKKINPEFRQKSKTFSLAVPYGSNEYRISQILKIEPQEAKQIIENYLDAYPDLKRYMEDQEYKIKTFGKISTSFGRIRHLPQARDLYRTYNTDLYNKRRMMSRLGEDEGAKVYYTFRNFLNLAKNFPIQATAAHICNHAMIKLSDSFKKHKINGWIALQIHDEITCIVKEEQAELAASLLKAAMEDNPITNQIDVPMKADPIIADNFAEAK